MEEYFTALAKYNFWQDTFPEQGFFRKDYTDKILGFTGNKLVKVLVGQRRVGKSYILRQVIGSLIDNGVNPVNTLYINKEFTDFDFIADYKVNISDNLFHAPVQLSGQA